MNKDSFHISYENDELYLNFTYNGEDKMIHIDKVNDLLSEEELDFIQPLLFKVNLIDSIIS